MGRAQAGKPALTKEQQSEFDVFWLMYPRHQAKLDAMKAWVQLNPSEEKVGLIFEALTWQVHQPSWADGQFVPLPASWLRAERWHDEPVRYRREVRL